MICVISFHSGDCEKARELLEWIEKLGHVKAFEVLLVADAGTSSVACSEIHEVAQRAFKSATLIASPTSVIGWPDGPNSNFSTAATWCAVRSHDFLFMEPDCVPLKPDWLKRITEEWRQSPQSYFMGHIYAVTQPLLPERAMSGVAVYTSVAGKMFEQRHGQAWEITNAGMMVAHGKHTDLILHRFGTVDLPPRFVEGEFDPKQTPPYPIPFGWIGDKVVLFHRDKSHSLIPILKRKLFPNERHTPRMRVAFNVCSKDIGQAVHHATWMVQLVKGRKKWENRATVCHDPSIDILALNKFIALLRQCFEFVDVFVYPRPDIPHYPACANWAFASVALHMSDGDEPWFWFEADSCVLTYDWLDKLDTEYDRCGKAVMGAVVPHMGHTQGTAVYPADAFTRFPKTMACINDAFDMVSKGEIGNDRHDASHLLFCVWTIENGRFSPVGGGHVPSNITAAMARTIPKTAVYFHRTKDNSLCELLMKGEYVHG